MSGGSYDYGFSKLNALAEAIDRRSREEPQGKTLRRAFAKMLRRMADAAYELEWADSGDTDWAQAEAALRRVVKPADELAMATEDAKAACQELERLLTEVTP